MLNHVFTTPIFKDKTILSPEVREAVCAYFLGLRAASEGEVKSNRGGWHSTGNLFAPEHQQFPELRDVITKALFAYVGEVMNYRGEIQLAITGWTVINGPGNYNVPHNHAANLMSGALYLAVPPDMDGGAIVFQDPRLNLNAHETEGMRRLKVRPPWANPVVQVAPVVGDILVFPSWLNHWVEPFRSADSNAIRIVVSFNASVM